MNEHLNFVYILRKAADFYQIYKDDNNRKWIKIDGYFYDEGDDNGKGTSRCVEYSGYDMPLIEFLEFKYDENRINDMGSEHKQHIEDMTEDKAYQKMKEFYNGGEQINCLAYKELTIDTPVGNYVNIDKKYNNWIFKPCPFCGSNKIDYKSRTLSYNAGKDCPCTIEVKVYAYCEYCGARSGSIVGDVVYDDEKWAMAIDKWNKRV